MGDDHSEEEFLSTIHHALRATRRRQVIREIATEDKSVITVSDLARRIAAQEHSLRLDHATGEPYRNVYNALSQTHLPTLDAAGIVIYDPMRQRIAKGPNLTLAHLLIAISQPTVEILQDDESQDDPEQQ